MLHLHRHSRQERRAIKAAAVIHIKIRPFGPSIAMAASAVPLGHALGSHSGKWD
jgi:hypothetical protein